MIHVWISQKLYSLLNKSDKENCLPNWPPPSVVARSYIITRFVVSGSGSSVVMAGWYSGSLD